MTIAKHEQSCHCLVSSSSWVRRKLHLMFLNIFLVNFGTCHDHFILRRKEEFISREYFPPSLKYENVLQSKFTSVLRIAAVLFCTALIIGKEL